MTTLIKERCVIGFDPGIGRLGYSVLSGSLSHPKIITFGCWKTNPQHSQADRLLELGRLLEKFLAKYKPTDVAVEKLFFSKNVKTALVVSEARGLIIYLAKKNNHHLTEFSPQELKLAATGQGNATKQQVQKMLQIIFKLSAPPQPDDAADALALALCAFTVRPR